MIYIAGKISGLPHAVAVAKFAETKKQLINLGLRVINPMQMGIDHLPYEDQISECKKAISTAALAIFFQRDWEDSNGSNSEFLHVKELNDHRNPKIVMYYEENNGYKLIEKDIRDKSNKAILACLIPIQNK